MNNKDGCVGCEYFTEDNMCNANLKELGKKQDYLEAGNCNYYEEKKIINDEELKITNMNGEESKGSNHEEILKEITGCKIKEAWHKRDNGNDNRIELVLDNGKKLIFSAEDNEYDLKLEKENHG